MRIGGARTPNRRCQVHFSVVWHQIIRACVFLQELTPRGARVRQSPLPKSQSVQGAKPANVRKAGAVQKRRRITKMSLGVSAVGALIAVVAVFTIGFSIAPAPIEANGAASHPEPSSIATIILRSNSSGCQQRSFNNQTGQISDQKSPCHNDIVLDAKGMPIPAGTMHTLNSISKSFK